MAGLAYDVHQVAPPVAGIGDLFDPRYRGRVTMLADFRDGLGMIMRYQGHSPTNANPATVSLAVARVRAAVEGQQIARFTGNADFADLVSGRVVIAQVRSTDMAHLRAARPSLRFVVPESGSTVSTRDMVIPDTTDNQVAAEAWMQWIYDPANYAAMIAQVGATAVLADLHDDLARVGGPAAVDPLVDPPESVWAQLSSWPDLDPVSEAAYAAAYAHAAG
jgi:spermidine/putrescine transport system substrate-binding protein